MNRSGRKGSEEWEPEDAASLQRKQLRLMYEEGEREEEGGRGVGEDVGFGEAQRGEAQVPDARGVRLKRLDQRMIEGGERSPMLFRWSQVEAAHV